MSNNITHFPSRSQPAAEPSSLTHHRLQLDRTGDEIVERHRAVRTVVPMRQRVQHPIVQLVAGRVERVAQLERVQTTGMVAIVQLEDGLPFGNVRQQQLELVEAELAGAVTIVHCDHRAAHVLGEAVLRFAGRHDCGKWQCGTGW